MGSCGYVHVEKLSVDGKSVVAYFKVPFLHLHRILKTTTETFSLRAFCVLFVVHWLTDNTIQHLYSDDFNIDEISATPTNR